MSDVEHHFDPRSDRIMRAAVDLSALIIEAYNQGQLWDEAKTESVAHMLATKNKFDTQSTEMLIAAVPSLLNSVARPSHAHRSSTHWWLAAAAVFATIMVAFVLWPRQPSSTGWNCMHQTECGVERTPDGPAFLRGTGDFVEIRGLDSFIGDRILNRLGTRYIVRRDDNDFAMITMISGGVRVRHRGRDGEFKINRNQLVVLLPNEIRPRSVKLLSRQDMANQGIPQTFADWAEEMRLKLLTENEQFQQRWEQVLRRGDAGKRTRGDVLLAKAISQYQKEGNMDALKRLRRDEMPEMPEIPELLLKIILDGEKREGD